MIFSRILLFFFLYAFLFLAPSSMRNPLVAEEEYIRVLKEISSEAYKGRGVGEGLELARDYLLEELKRINLKAAFSSNEYLQELKVFKKNIMGENNFLGNSYSKKDFIPMSFSISGKIENAALAFLGFGISFQEEGKIYDDYAGLDVRGKIVIVFTGDPAIGTSDSIFRNPKYYYYSRPIYKIQNAIKHGASGIIFVKNPISFEGGAEKDLQFLERAGGGTVFDILAGMSSNRYINGYLGEEKLFDLQKKIAKEQKPFSFILNKSINMGVDLERELGTIHNIIAFLPGADPSFKNEYIVLGAHYDHLGFGGESSRAIKEENKIHYGADDNASGVQALLHIAKRLQGKNRRPFLFCLFTGEELGLLGSEHFVKNLPIPSDARIVSMLNLDMVGRMQDNQLIVMAQDSSHDFGDLVRNSKTEAMDIHLVKGPNAIGSSDHAPFLRKEIPALFLSTGIHSDYHRPSDTWDKINMEGLRKVVNYALSLLQNIDALDQAPSFNEDIAEDITAPRTGRGYGSYFGSIPSFKQTEENKGVELEGVKSNSPAEKLGLQKGDLITFMGEIKIKNLHDLVFALRFYRPKEKIKVHWNRQGVLMHGIVELEARKQD